MNQPRTYAERVSVALAQLLAVVGFVAFVVVVLAVAAPDRWPVQ